MVQISSKKLWGIIGINLILVIILSFGINYAYSKIFWSNRVSVHAGINSEEYKENVKSDTLTKAFIGQAYKIGTAFEVYKRKDPLLKVVSENHGALELAVASGKGHFSDLAKTRDAIIRKIGEGNLIFSIPSYTNKNVRSIIFANESKIFMELNNFDEILLNSKNLSIGKEGVLQLNDIKMRSMGSENLSNHLAELQSMLVEANQRIEILENRLNTKQ